MEDERLRHAALLLGVRQGERGPAQLRAAFLRGARRYHPDSRAPDAKPDAHLFAGLTAAYGLLLGASHVAEPVMEEAPAPVGVVGVAVARPLRARDTRRSQRLATLYPRSSPRFAR